MARALGLGIPASLGTENIGFVKGGVSHLSRGSGSFAEVGCMHILASETFLN